MKILGAMLGGTIASSNISGTIKLGRSSFAREYLEKNFPGHEFVFPEFETYSSEDATPYLYRDALKRILSALENGGFDGILITHGTDTCAFFAQLAARVLVKAGIPFAITGSMKSPDVDPAEAEGNLSFAVRSLEEGKTGVVFKNRSAQQQLYSPYLIMSPDINGIYTEYEDGLELETRDCSRFLTKEKLPEILVIPAVPGALLPQTGFDKVLICCNHSGTASGGLTQYVKKWTSQGIPCFMAPVPTTGGVYESRKNLRDTGAVELPGMPLEGAWAEVVLR